MKKRLLTGLLAAGLMAAMLPGVATADAPVVRYSGYCITESGDLSIIRTDDGGVELIRDYATKVATGAFDDCVAGYVALDVNGEVVRTTIFGPRTDR